MAEQTFAPVQERVPKPIPQRQGLTTPDVAFQAPPEVSTDTTVYIMGSIPSVKVNGPDGPVKVINPRQQIDVCGVSFPLYVERSANPDDKNDTTKIRDYHRQTLTRSQYDAIMARLKERAFRFGPDWQGGRIIDYTRPLVPGGAPPRYDARTDILLYDFVWIREDSIFASALKSNPDLVSENAALSRNITAAHRETEVLRSTTAKQDDEIMALKARLAGFEAERKAKEEAEENNSMAAERRSKKNKTAPALG